jgi:aldose 1-epimerase
MSIALPSGRQHTIVFGDQQAVVVEVGAALRSYRVAGHEVVSGYVASEMASTARGQPLIPWPNQLRGGQYSWNGTQHQLPLSEPAKHNAIHGLVRWTNWTTARQSTSEVELRQVLHPQPGHPFTLDLSVTYRLDESGLTVTTSATNAGSFPLPYAAGQHPYLAAPDVVDVCRLQLDAMTYIPTDDCGVPAGRASVAGSEYDFRSERQIGQAELDLAFTDLARDDDGRAWFVFRSPDGATKRVWVDESYRYVELFTADSVPEQTRQRRPLGVEPMTSPPNAFADGIDVITLDPGQRKTCVWGMSCSRRHRPAASTTTEDRNDHVDRPPGRAARRRRAPLVRRHRTERLSGRRARLLRRQDTPHLRARRRVALLQFVSNTALGVVGLYQLGLLRRVPEPPLPGLASAPMPSTPPARRTSSATRPTARWAFSAVASPSRSPAWAVANVPASARSSRWRCSPRRFSTPPAAPT